MRWNPDLLGVVAPFVDLADVGRFAVASRDVDAALRQPDERAAVLAHLGTAEVRAAASLEHAALAEATRAWRPVGSNRTGADSDAALASMPADAGPAAQAEAAARRGSRFSRRQRRARGGRALRRGRVVTTAPPAGDVPRRGARGRGPAAARAGLRAGDGASAAGARPARRGLRAPRCELAARRAREHAAARPGHARRGLPAPPRRRDRGRGARAADGRRAAARALPLRAPRLAAAARVAPVSFIERGDGRLEAPSGVLRRK